MSTFSKGDTVRCTHGAPEDGLFAGRNYEAKAVYVATHGDAYVDVGVHPDGWNASRFEKVEPEDTDDELADWERALLADAEPEPLKEGDWVQVWAQVNRLRSDGDTECRFFYGVKHADGSPKDSYDERVRNDAIVRPADGAVPPWVTITAADRQSVAISKVLIDEGGMDPMVAHEVAESLIAAGCYADEGGAS